jgi:hypothetical protein
MKKYNNAILTNRIKCHTVVDWYPTDTKERFESLPKEHQDYWQKQPPITYNLNTYGFRSDEFPEKECRESITFLGCSNTFGSGLQKERTWPSLVAKHYDLLEINLAVVAGSLDSAFRVYNEWQPIHKSKITCLFIPPTNRMELARNAVWDPNMSHWENVGHWSLGEKSNYGFETKNFIIDLLSDIDQEIRTDRNLAAIKYIAQETGSKFIAFPFFNEVADEKARDNMHPGHAFNIYAANKFIEAIGEL